MKIQPEPQISIPVSQSYIFEMNNCSKDIAAFWAVNHKIVFEYHTQEPI
jgi:hypothetical protein